MDFGQCNLWGLRSIERFAAGVGPLLEREMGPLDRIGLAEAA